MNEQDFAQLAALRTQRQNAPIADDAAKIARLEAALQIAVTMLETGTYAAPNGVTLFWEESPSEACLAVLEAFLRKALEGGA